MIRAALAAGLALAVAPRVATAEPIDLGPATLALDDSWTGPAVGAAPITSVTRSSGAAQVVVVRYDVPNLEAWRDRTRPPHVDAIVAGFTATPGLSVVGKPKVSRLGTGRTPVLDLTLRRTLPRDERLAVRVILFRTLTMAAIASGPHPERATAALTPD